MDPSGVTTAEATMMAQVKRVAENLQEKRERARERESAREREYVLYLECVLYYR